MGASQVEDKTSGGEAPILGVRTTMKTVRPRWTAAIVAIMCTMDALAQEIRGPQNLTAPFSLTLGTTTRSFKVGTALNVNVSVKNISNQDIYVYRALSENMDQGGWVYFADVCAEEGDPPPPTLYEFIVARSVGSGGYIKLTPGKSSTDHVNVSKLYDLSRPGKYRIKLQRFDVQTKSLVMSDGITVTVTR